MKTCCKCGDDKPLTQFHNDKSRADGKDPRCKQCIRRRDRQRYQRDREHILSQKANYRRTNRDEIRKRQRKHYRQNRKQIIEHKTDRLSDPQLKITENYRKRINNFIRRRGIGTANELIGCEWNEFKTYMTAQFKQGMSWHNYGEWEVDHIMPCSAFDQTDPDHRAVCWHYTNLMPLWSDKNRHKFNNLPTDMNIDLYVNNSLSVVK